MRTPHFFSDIASISLYDPLSDVLGAAEDGILDYTYEDAVKLAGHSCPTVAGAYLMCTHGLKSLYTTDIPVRGEIRVLMKGMLGEGTVGVSANVASFITGATEMGGFHGLGGKFDRRNLLSYEADIAAEMAFERTDTGERVEVSYDPSCVPMDPALKEMLPLVVSGRATEEEKQRFGALWQERVRKILIDFYDDPRLVQCQLTKTGADA